MNSAKYQPAPKKPFSRVMLVVITMLLLPPLALVSFLFWRWQTGQTDTIGKVDFSAQLPIPALAESTVSSDGTRVFNLDLQSGHTEFFSGRQTATWGINGSYLGPTLRAKRGEPVRIHVNNHLSETTTMHWHGMHVPATMDGGPHQPIEPNSTWSPSWTIKQPGATLWYHPHPHGETAAHVYRGLAGMFIIDDETTAAAQLPHTYGVDDIPVIVQDKKFRGSTKQLDESPGGGSTGILGKEILVNGARTPNLRVTTGLVRLRLLNASGARIYNFGLSNNQPLTLVASDGGLLEKPVEMQRIVLSPGERAEVLVTVRPGENISLQSHPLDLRAGFLENRNNGGDDSFDIMQLRGQTQLASAQPIPAELAAIERLDEATSVNTRSFELLGVNINGQRMDMQRVDFAVAKGSTEIWNVANMGGGPHNFHVHDVQFQVLSFNGTEPPPDLQGWKDTIFLNVKDSAQLIMRFGDYTDPDHPFMYHCHLLRHEDLGMMGQFVITDDGTAPTALPMQHRH